MGSIKLISIIEKINNDIDTPASDLILHGTLMWYGKNIQINNLSKLIKKENFSDIATRIIKFMIVKHCSVHRINYRDRQRINEKFKLSPKKTTHKKKKDE